MKKIAFIGGGNLASALLTGMLKSGVFDKTDILVAEPNEKQRIYLSETIGVKTTSDNCAAVAFADAILLTVKPNIYQAVIAEIKDCIADKLIITVAAGTSTDYVSSLFEKPVRIVRSMPNTPAAVGAGMTSLSPNAMATAEDIKFAKALFGCVGQVEIIKESLMDVASAIAGSSPALVYMFIEALADGAVLKGMPRQQAYRMAAQAVLGSAQMVRDSGVHPGQLKDNVASPGGTTIEAIRQLEEGAFRGSLIEAIARCVDKSIEISQSK